MMNLNNRIETRLLRRYLLLFCIIYILVMLYLVVVRLQPLYWLTGNEVFNTGRLPRAYNLLPFQTIQIYSLTDYNILGNIIMFVPMGIYGRMLTKKWSHALLLIVAAPLCIETLQFVFATGAFDVDDVILNALGGLLGILLWLAYMWVMRRHQDRAIIIAAAVSGALTPYLVVSAVKFFAPRSYAIGIRLADILILLLFFGAVLFPLARSKRRLWAVTVALGLLFAVPYYTLLIHFM